MSSTPANGCRGNNNSKSEDRRHLGDLIEELVSKAGPGAPAALTEEGLLKNWVSIHLHVQGRGGGIPKLCLLGLWCSTEYDG